MVSGPPGPHNEVATEDFSDRDRSSKSALFGGSVTQDEELILVAELADLELARRFASALGATCPR
jgi:hypothetical protein